GHRTWWNWQTTSNRRKDLRVPETKTVMKDKDNVGRISRSHTTLLRRGGPGLFQVVWFSRGLSKPPLLTLGWLWKRYQSGWISRERCLPIWIVWRQKMRSLPAIRRPIQRASSSTPSRAPAE